MKHTISDILELFSYAVFVILVLAQIIIIKITIQFRSMGYNEIQHKLISGKELEEGLKIGSLEDQILIRKYIRLNNIYFYLTYLLIALIILLIIAYVNNW